MLKIVLDYDGTLTAEDGLVERLSRVNESPLPFVDSKSYQHIPHKAKSIS